MAREARQAESEWLPAELLGAAGDGMPEPAEAWHPAEEPAEESGPADELSGEPRLLGAVKPEPEIPVANSTQEPELPERSERSEGRVIPEHPAISKRRVISEGPEQARPSWAPTGPTAPAPLPAGALDLNEATFDQLHRLGLSFHQAAGLIGRREQRGGFSSPDELDELAGAYGLPLDAIQALKQAAGA